MFSVYWLWPRLDYRVALANVAAALDDLNLGMVRRFCMQHCQLRLSHKAPKCSVLLCRKSSKSTAAPSSTPALSSDESDPHSFTTLL